MFAWSFQPFKKVKSFWFTFDATFMHVSISTEGMSKCAHFVVFLKHVVYRIAVNGSWPKHLLYSVFKNTKTKIQLAQLKSFFTSLLESFIISICNFVVWYAVICGMPYYALFIQFKQKCSILAGRSFLSITNKHIVIFRNSYMFFAKFWQEILSNFAFTFSPFIASLTLLKLHCTNRSNGKRPEEKNCDHDLLLKIFFASDDPQRLQTVIVFYMIQSIWESWHLLHQFWP